MIIVDTPGLHKPHDAPGRGAEHLGAARRLKTLTSSPCSWRTRQQARRPRRRVGGQPSLTARIASTRRRSACFPRPTWCTTDQLHGAGRGCREAGERGTPWWGFPAEIRQQRGRVHRGGGQYFLPEGPGVVPAPTWKRTSRIEVIVAEFIREKILRTFRDEVPHSIGVHHRAYGVRQEEGPQPHPSAVIYVERESQKGIIIGKKRRGHQAASAIDARADLEQLLGDAGVSWTCPSR